MKIPKSIIAAILISAAIRITILLQTNTVTYGGYQELTHIQHIAETGLPRITDPDAWLGAEYSLQQLYHYLAAFLTILVTPTTAALLLTNLAALTIPLISYYLAKEVTTSYNAPAIIALASAFTPLLYRETTLTASPLALAIPLLLAAYYYFLRLGKTPRDQKLFILTTIALTATHPISLLLPVAMTITLILQRVQAITFQQPMAEATLFTAFFALWGNLLANNQLLQNHGLTALINPATTTGLAQAVTATGLLVLLAATYAASNYLKQETSQSAHALTALAFTALAATILRLLPQETGLLLFSLALLPIAAGAIERYQKSKHQSRAPSLYTLGAALLTLIFLTTSAVPAISLGYDRVTDTPTLHEQQLIQELSDAPRLKTHWDARRGDYLRYHQFPVATTNNALASAQATTINQELAELETANNPVRYIQLLTKQNIRYIILEEGHNAPITDRCFSQLPTTNYEVYRLTCVVN